MDRFAECFDGVDRLVILPVWAVNEEPRELDFAKVFAKYSPIIAERVKRDENGDAVIVLKDSNVIINKGVVIGFGAGDITYQLRGQK